MSDRAEVKEILSYLIKKQKQAKKGLGSNLSYKKRKGNKQEREKLDYGL